MSHLLLRRIALVTAAAALSSHALAADAVLSFSGTCQNSGCTDAGANDTVPATVQARITLAGLEWVAAGDGFAAVFTDARAFSYTGPRSFVRAGDSGLMPERVQFFSTSASAAGIVEFDITFANGASYFAGDASGFGMGLYFPQDVGGIIVPIPFNIESSTQAGSWQLSAVPEPAPAGLLGAGLAVLAWRRRGHRASFAAASGGGRFTR